MALAGVEDEGNWFGVARGVRSYCRGTREKISSSESRLTAVLTGHEEIMRVSLDGVMDDGLM